jgi:hypothetical protein
MKYQFIFAILNMDDSGIVGHVATLCFGEYDILGMNKFGIEVSA